MFLCRNLVALQMRCKGFLGGGIERNRAGLAASLRDILSNTDQVIIPPPHLSGFILAYAIPAMTGPLPSEKYEPGT